MKKAKLAALLLVSAMLLTAWPAQAWGPRTQIAVATTALSLLSKQSNTPFTRLRAAVQEGASLDDAAIAKLFPEYPADPVAAVESEMYLLQAVGTQRVDAYFAYRMGALAKVISRLTEPLQDADASYRNLYYTDVESAIGNTELAAEPRQVVEPKAYFERMRRAASTNNDLIVREYQNGRGFAGVARQQLGRDASRSVNAIADVWHTIMTGASARGTVSEDRLKAYVVDSYAFIIRRNNNAEIDAADERLSALVPKTADMSVQIGDLYYEAQMLERAMKEYTAARILAPDRRDVVEKLATYYMTLGEKAEEAGKLEDAMDRYADAAAANPLHPTAEASRIRIAGMIRDREARLTANQQALQQADGFIALSEQEANDGHYAEAAVLLRQAQDTFGAVTDEFPLEYQKAMRGTQVARAQLENIKGALVDNAQSFSGSGFALDAKNLAQTSGKGLEEAALKQILQQEYQRELLALQDRVAPSLAGK